MEYSYSKLDTYNQCGYRYKLKYVDKNYVNMNTVATSVGTLVHGVNEFIANNLKDGQTINYVQLANSLLQARYELSDSFGDSFDKELDKSNRTYSQKLLYYIQKDLKCLENYVVLNNYKVVGAEVEFKYKYSDDCTFHGFIDLVLQDTITGKYLIYDVKTYATPIENAKLATPLQFVIYKLAAVDLYNTTLDNIECAYDLPFCECKQPAGTTNFITRGRAKLDKLLDGIKNEDFKPKPSPLCHWCEFCPTNKDAPEKTKHLCPFYSLWTRENPTFKTANTIGGQD